MNETSNNPYQPGQFGGSYEDFFQDQTANQPYEYFVTRQERLDLYQIGRSLSDYVANNGVGTVCFLDRSARPAYIAMEEFWKLQYPSVPAPQIRFLNPKGFVSREDVRRGDADLTELMYNDRYKQNHIEDPNNIRPTAEIVDELRQGLEGDVKGVRIPAERPILLFDACMHTGDSVRPILDKFRRAGIDNVRFGVVNDSNSRSNIRPDFVAMPDVPAGVCYPFAKDDMTEKTYGSIVSAKNMDTADAQLGRTLRREIAQSVREFALR